MSNYSVEITNNKFDPLYTLTVKFTKFLLFFVSVFYIQNYYLTNQSTYEISILSASFYLTVIFIVIFYILDTLYPNCNINIIETNNNK